MNIRLIVLSLDFTLVFPQHYSKRCLEIVPNGERLRLKFRWHLNSSFAAALTIAKYASDRKAS